MRQIKHTSVAKFLRRKGRLMRRNKYFPKLGNFQVNLESRGFMNLTGFDEESW
jgi:hypothetical protein